MEKRNIERTILIDSDVLVGFFYEADAHHRQVVETFEDLNLQKFYFVVTSLVVAETATVLSHRKGQAAARMFLDWADKLAVIHITEGLQKGALSLFREQTVKGSSVVDCANAVVMKQYSIPQIFAFDKVYGTKFGLKVVPGKARVKAA